MHPDNAAPLDQASAGVEAGRVGGDGRRPRCAVRLNCGHVFHQRDLTYSQQQRDGGHRSAGDAAARSTSSSTMRAPTAAQRARRTATRRSFAKRPSSTSPAMFHVSRDALPHDGGAGQPEGGQGGMSQGGARVSAAMQAGSARATARRCARCGRPLSLDGGRRAAARSLHGVRRLRSPQDGGGVAEPDGRTAPGERVLDRRSATSRRTTWRRAARRQRGGMTVRRRTCPPSHEDAKARQSIYELDTST